MEALTIKNLKKNYKNFTLDIKELEIKTGFITGFIGPNGAGKTTTIKSIMGMCKFDEGDIKVFGNNPLENLKSKEEIGYVGETSGFLEESTLLNIKKSISMFYSNWDEEIYINLIKKFKLDEKKVYKELSKGKKKQFELAIALSHHPKILIMDEPTANLDPIVRNEVLEIIQGYMENEELTVFYSTHLTSDLDKCADYIVFVYDGKIVLEGEKDIILEKHSIVKGKNELLDNEIRMEFISVKENSFGFEGIISDKDKAYEIFGEEVIYEKPTLEDIMLYYTRRA